MKEVLVSLYPGYGLGDGVQVSAVLRHLAKHRPDWNISYRADEGKYQVGRGLVHRHFAYGAEPPDTHYDFEVQIKLYDSWCNWDDRPNTRVSNCLHSDFGMKWDAERGRYSVEVRYEVDHNVQKLMAQWTAHRQSLNVRVVGLHYQGDSSGSRKNLTPHQAAWVCRHIMDLGRFPLVLDWRDQSVVSHELRVGSTGSVGTTQERSVLGRDAEYNVAVIHQCEAFVGIDSGPGKCAAATDTPSLIVWTGHNPACFYDPAPNVTHLVPFAYKDLYPESPRHVVDWFEDHNKVLFYDYADPLPQIEQWLREVLK